MGTTRNHRNRIEQWVVVSGGWPLAVGGGWQLVVLEGCSSERSLTKKIGALKESPGTERGGNVGGRRGIALRVRALWRGIALRVRAVGGHSVEGEGTVEGHSVEGEGSGGAQR